MIKLRNVTEEDLPIFFEQQLDPAANHMAAFIRENPLDRDAFDRHWEKLLANDAIVKRTILFEDKVAGFIAKYELFEQPEITYWIGKSYWGKGIATQALSEFLTLLDIRPLHAHTANDNSASIRVLEKCGFVKIGESKFFANARGKEIDEYIWRLESKRVINQCPSK